MFFMSDRNRMYVILAGSKIDNTTRRYQRGSNLHFTRVDKEKDAGQFTCIAQDSHGLSITSSEASLNIQCKYHKNILFGLLSLVIQFAQN